MRRTFYAAFGILALLIGLAMALWVGYNVFVEQTEGFSMKGMSPLILIGMGVMWLKKGFGKAEVEKREDVPTAEQDPTQQETSSYGKEHDQYLNKR